MPKRKNAAVARPKSKGKAQTQSGSKKHKTAAESKPKYVDPAPESSSEEDVEDEDMAFVQENVAKLSFLKSMKPESLSAITKERKKKLSVLPKKQQNSIPVPSELTESEDEGEEEDGSDNAGSDESDLEIVSDSDDGDEEEDLLEDLALTDSEEDDGVESLSEEEYASESSNGDKEQDYKYQNSKARRAQQRKAMMEGSMEYEQKTRSFGESKKPKDSTKLPIKTADGRLVEVDESENEEEEEDDDDTQENDSAEEGKPGSESDQDLLSDSDSGSDSGSESDPDAEARPSAKSKRAENNANSEEPDLLEEPDRDSMTRKQYIVVQQNRLAGLANLVMQDPENSSKALRTLNDISSDADVKVKQLGLLTQLAVYRDIIPDYRIRELTEKEKQTKVTREVRQQRIFEERLVKNYGSYLKQLFVATKQALKIFGNDTADVETGTVATRALGELINTHPHFNFRKDILSALIDIYVQPSSRINMPAFAPMARVARLAILRLFRDDISGEYSQNAVDLASKRIKRLSYRVDGSVLRPWLHLRLREELRENPDDRKQREEDTKRKEQMRERRRAQRRNKGGAALREAKRAAHESKKQAHARKMQREVEKTMRVAEAEVSREERERWYGETLKQVFVTYFRILKQKDNIGALLPAVLEGLARYAHLISVEFFVDLFQLLKLIMRGQHGVGVGAEEPIDDSNDLVSTRVSLRTSLLCTLTALHILTGQGEALNLDIKDFFHQIYALLPPLGTTAQIEATRMSALSDGTRYTVYLSPADVAAANAARIAQRRNARVSGNTDEQLDEAMWEETVRSEADLLFECLELMFLGRSKVSSITRVASFCKRLCECALYWPPRTAVRAIEFVHKVFIKYPALERMFSSEEQAGSGLYLQEMDDPDMCNPFATCLYELHWLQIHHHASVQEAVARLLEFARAEEKKHRI
ncbi:hypothetical protein LPJ57_003295 [Coemansia sp. RSA 486]|nr:hypothetical protein LPJ57_003295 [Coemansia sp. RSA 486]